MGVWVDSIPTLNGHNKEAAKKKKKEATIVNGQRQPLVVIVQVKPHSIFNLHKDVRQVDSHQLDGQEQIRI